MKRRSFFFLLPGIAAVAAGAPKGEDFGKFFLAEVKARTGNVLGGDGLPELRGRWRIERDQYGFQIYISGLTFVAVDSFLTKVLGEAQAPAVINLSGHLQSGYYKNASGMHIQLVDKKPELYLVAVGGKKK